MFKIQKALTVYSNKRLIFLRHHNRKWLGSDMDLACAIWVIKDHSFCLLQRDIESEGKVHSFSDQKILAEYYNCLDLEATMKAWCENVKLSSRIHVQTISKQPCKTQNPLNYSLKPGSATNDPWAAPGPPLQVVHFVLPCNARWQLGANTYMRSRQLIQKPRAVSCFIQI